MNRKRKDNLARGGGTVEKTKRNLQIRPKLCQTLRSESDSRVRMVEIPRRLGGGREEVVGGVERDMNGLGGEEEWRVG